MTPPVHNTASPKVLPFAPPPPPPPPAGDEKKHGSAPSIVANPLYQKLQSSGRTPSHPLTANPPKSSAKEEVVIAKVSPADAKRADKLLNEAIVLAKKNKLEQAFKSFQKAYQLDPNNERIARSVAKILNLGGQPLQAMMVCSEFLRRFPNSLVVRGMRAAIGESLLPQMQAMIGSAPKEQQPKIAQTAQEILWVTMTDQALLAKAEAPRLRTALKGMEGDLSQAHDKPAKDKLQVLSQIQSQAEQMFTLASLPSLPPQEAEAIGKELRALGVESLAVAARFANADKDPEVHAQGKLFEAYQAMAEGKDSEAIAAFETVRSEGFKQVGGGDAAKGEALVREKFAQAQRAIRENKPQDASKALEGLPAALATAHDFLDRMESQKLLPANLGVLKAWEQRVNDEHASKSKDANGFFGSAGQFWDTIWGNSTNLDRIAKEAAAEHELIGKVRERLMKGESRTVLEALQALGESGPAEIKDRAKLAFEQSKAGQFDSGTIKVGRLIRYTSTVHPEDKVGGEILEETASLAGKISDETSATLYGLVGLLSRNPEQAKRASENYDKLVERIEKAKQKSNKPT